MTTKLRTRIAWQAFAGSPGAEIVGTVPTVGETIRVRLTSGRLVPAQVVKVLGTLRQKSHTSDGIQSVHTIVFQEQ